MAVVVGRSTRSLAVMKRVLLCAIALAAVSAHAKTSEVDALDASEALLRHVLDYFDPKQAPVAVCLDAYVAADVPLLVERMRGFRPLIRPVSECRSMAKEAERVAAARLGFPIKEAEGRFLQSIDYDGGSNCVFQIQRVNGTWKVSLKIACIRS